MRILGWILSKLFSEETLTYALDIKFCNKIKDVSYMFNFFTRYKDIDLGGSENILNAEKQLNLVKSVEKKKLISDSEQKIEESDENRVDWLKK